MAFHVYPDPPTAPFAAAAAGTPGDASSYRAVPELAELTPEAGKPLFFVCVALQGAPGTGPSVWLKVANAAAATSGEGEISAAHTGANPAQIGDGTHRGVVNAIYGGPDDDNVALVSVYTFVPRLAFEIRVQNRDAGPRQLTWVVATTEKETRQPWIDAAEAVTPDADGGNAEPGSTLTLPRFTIPVVNRGTGTLQIKSKGHLDDGSSVTLEIPSFPITFPKGSLSPNSSLDVVFRPKRLLLLPLKLRLDSNDPRATGEAGHNHVVSLIDRAAPLPGPVKPTRQRTQARPRTRKRSSDTQVEPTGEQV